MKFSITAAAVFIKNKKVLLEKRRTNEDNYAGMWALPGGHKRKKETIYNALKREMREELRINVKRFKPVGIFKDKDSTSNEMFHHHAFLCQEWKHDIKKSYEQDKLKWWNLNKFNNVPNHRKIDEKVLKQLKLI